MIKIIFSFKVECYLKLLTSTIKALSHLFTIILLNRVISSSANQSVDMTRREKIINEQ
jgi:hypothetical protein